MSCSLCLKVKDTNGLLVNRSMTLCYFDYATSAALWSQITKHGTKITRFARYGHVLLDWHVLVATLTAVIF
jgi:hypothetical protein